jgi:hypothetical protein
VFLPRFIPPGGENRRAQAADNGRHQAGRRSSSHVEGKTSDEVYAEMTIWA